MSALWWLLACSPEPAPADPTWTPQGVVAPALGAADRDGDGTLDAEEYQARAFLAPPFGDVDTNADGRIDRSELVDMTRHQDPAGFVPGWERKQRSDDFAEPRTPAQQEVLDALLFLNAEVHDPVAQAEIEQAADTGRFDSPESRAVLTTIQAAWVAAGRTFPVVLSSDSPQSP